jgi:hypothetical protein
MKRQISIVALIAAALIACQATSAQAKPTRAPAHKPTTTGVKLPSGNIDPGYGVKPGQLKNSGGIFGTQPVTSQPISKQPPVFTGPLTKPTAPIVFPPRLPTPPPTPVTWGGNPPRAPTHGCGDKCGCHHGDCYSHDHRHCHDSMWWGQMCFGDMFGNNSGDCDDFSGDCDSDICQ